MLTHSLPVLCFVGNHPTYTAAWIWYVAIVTRNNMNVDMRDRLTCCNAVVEPNVETVGMMFFNQAFSDFLNQVPQRELLVSW